MPKKKNFRVRAERQPNGDTNIYVSNHILEADDVVDNGKIIWRKKIQMYLERLKF